MSGGQQGGPQMGGGKGGPQQMPSGGKGGPQGHMMPNGQRQTRPGGPPPGQGMPQANFGMMQPGQGFHTYLQGLQGMSQPQTGGGLPREQNVGQFGMPVSPQDQFGAPVSPQGPFGTPVSRGAPQANFGMPQSPQGQFGMPVSPQRQPMPMSGLLAKLYGG